MTIIYNKYIKFPPCEPKLQYCQLHVLHVQKTSCWKMETMIGKLPAVSGMITNINAAKSLP